MTKGVSATLNDHEFQPTKKPTFVERSRNGQCSRRAFRLRWLWLVSAALNDHEFDQLRTDAINRVSTQQTTNGKKISEQDYGISGFVETLY